MDLNRALHDLFGFGGFRPGQREAAEAALAGRDGHCDACFSGRYPLARTDTANGKFALEELAVVRS